MSKRKVNRGGRPVGVLFPYKILLRLTDDQAERCKEIAKSKNKTVATLLREWIDAAIEENAG